MKGRQACLGDVADFVNGAAFKPEDWGDDGYPIIRIQNLTDRSKPFNRTLRSVNEKLYVYPGDLLVSWSATLGVFEWDRAETGVLNQHIFRVLPDSSKIDKSYLRHAIVVALLAMKRHLHGATMQHVNRGEFLSTPLNLPPLPEQRRIAAILDQADAIRAKRREALAQLDSLTQSIFIEMFGESRANPKHWPTRGIVAACELIVDCVNRTAPLAEGATPYKMIRTTNVKSGKVSLDSVRYVDLETFTTWNRRATPRRGDVLLTREAPVGEAGMLTSDDQVFLGQRLMLYRPAAEQITSEFLLASFMSPFLQDQFEQHASGSTVKHLPLPACRAFELRMPPLVLQQTFATRIQTIESLKAPQRAALAELDALFAALQHRAFTGAL